MRPVTGAAIDAPLLIQCFHLVLQRHLCFQALLQLLRGGDQSNVTTHLPHAV